MHSNVEQAGRGREWRESGGEWQCWRVEFTAIIELQPQPALGLSNGNSIQIIHFIPFRGDINIFCRAASSV